MRVPCLRVHTTLCLLAVIAWIGAAPSAEAQDDVGARDIQAAVDAYLGSMDEAQLVGGPGSAGYDGGFYIRGGDFSLRINAVLQARYEAMDWDDVEPGPPDGAGDLSGFSLPRAVIRLSGDAPCNTRYFLELDFGHFGRRDLDTLIGVNPQLDPTNLGPVNQSLNYDNTREAWIEWGCSDALNLRMGQIRTAAPRQLMTPPELQQFVDISLASAFVGLSMPGYTDRNRDHGIMVHGRFGCDGDVSWLATITNGDGGDSIRNVLDHRSSDNLAFSARINWAFLDPIGYQEGALRQQTCGWYGEVGAWVYYYADRLDKPHTVEGDFLRYGVDLALGYGPFSLTAAVTVQDDADVPTVPATTTVLDDETITWLLQLGYMIPGSAFEVAARYSGYDTDGDVLGNGMASELALAVNYYLNGHGNKLQLDVSFIEVEDDGFLIYDRYPGYGNFLTNDDSAILIRFQWQLAL
ncbi:MAG: porin [Planctomycetota bacterium]|nr:porin [Planctomycetota bacterium]